MGRKVEIENRTRDTLIFPATKEIATADGKTKRVLDPERDIVLGDAANTRELLDSYGLEYGPKCPPPVVVVDQADIDALAPVVLANFKARVEKRQLLLRSAA